MSQFAFLKPEFTEIHSLAMRAERLALADPRASCFYARLTLETMVGWLYRHDQTLRDPFDTTLSARIHEPTFRQLAGNGMVTKAQIIKDLGNTATHNAKAVPTQNAVNAVRELFHLSYWLVGTNARGE